jgi:hypothetical protein
MVTRTPSASTDADRGKEPEGSGVLGRSDGSANRYGNGDGDAAGVARLCVDGEAAGVVATGEAAGLPQAHRSVAQRARSEMRRSTSL